MNIKKIFIFLWIAIAFPALIFAGGAGTTSGLFLRQEPTARIFSMGGVYLPIINEPGAAYINPAILGHITGHHISLSMWKGLDAVSQYNFLGIVLNAGRVGAFGINYLSYDSGLEEMYDINGNLSKITLQKDYAISAGWGRNITETLFIGGQVKSVNSELAQAYNANAMTFDMGAMFKSLDDRLTIGGGIQNINGELKYKNTGDPLPRTIRGGIGYRFAMGTDNVIIGADVQKPIDEDSLSGGFGVEYGFAQLPVSLRGGIKRINDEMGFSAGMGTKWKGIEMDYGFQPAGNLGETTQRFTISFNFGSNNDTDRAKVFKNKGMKKKAFAMGYVYRGAKITASVLRPKASDDITEEQAASIADAVSARLGTSPYLQIVAREQTEQVLKEQVFQYSVCADNDCAVEAGKLLGVKKIFYISAARLGGRYALTIKIIDVETGAQDKSFTTTSSSIEGLYKAAIKLAEEIALDELK